MAKAKEKYQANRSNKEDTSASDKKVAKIASKAILDQYTAGQGGMIVDEVAKTKAGDALFNKMGNTLAKGNPQTSKLAKKLDDVGALDAIDQGLSMGNGDVNNMGNSMADADNINLASNANNSVSNKSTPGTEANNTNLSSNNNNRNQNSNNAFNNEYLNDIINKKADKNKDNKKKDSSNQSKLSGKAFGFKGMKVKILLFGAVGLGFILLILLITIAISAVYDETIGKVKKCVDAVIGAVTDVIDYFSGNDDDDTHVSNELSTFADNVKSVLNDYPNGDVKFNAVYVISVFVIISSEDENIKLNNVSDNEIRNVVDSMYNDGIYDEDSFKIKLKTILQSYFPRYNSDNIDDLIEQIFMIYEEYKDYYDSSSYTNVCSVAGACSYSINGISTGDRTITKNVNISNLKVRLMQGGTWNGGSCGGTWGLALPNEELVDFEKYVLGVAYAESGGNSFEALKAQVIAARNFALSRADLMGNTNGRKLYQENGQWILQITNCVSDQAYCDPDRGCSKDVAANNQWGNVHSGINNPITYKPPLAENAPLRQAAMEVNGEVLINSEGYIVYTPYTNTNQVRWNNMANSGSDYKQILLSDYGSRGASNIKKMSCNTDGAGCNEVVGDYATWLQSGQSWSSIPLGGSSYTISSAGCLVTSISMLIAKSGVSTVVDGQFNPGTFVQKMNSVGGIDASGNFQWYSVSKAAPSFQFVNREYLSGKTRSEKLNVIKKLIDQGYYVVVEVMGNTGQHWVAINSVNGENIFMYDPATKYTDLWSRYNYNNTSAAAYFKVNG